LVIGRSKWLLTLTNRWLIDNKNFFIKNFKTSLIASISVITKL